MKWFSSPGSRESSEHPAERHMDLSQRWPQADQAGLRGGGQLTGGSGNSLSPMMIQGLDISGKFWGV